MDNFNSLFKAILLALMVLLAACIEQDEHFFASSHLNKTSQIIEYNAIHRLNLSIDNMRHDIDESGFSPILISQFELKNLNHGPWPQAWVAFNIDIQVKGERLASITRAAALQNHSLEVSLQQTLPKFGFKQQDIQLSISPIAWMPTYPLSILDSQKEGTLKISALDEEHLPQ